MVDRSECECSANINVSNDEDIENGIEFMSENGTES